MGGRALVYTRLSQDKRGDEENVEQQEVECRALADRLGLTVERVYTDNDLSATSGVVRPEFERLLADAQGRTDVTVVPWHLDRFVRLSSDLERVLALDLSVVGVHSGHLDLSTPAGRAVAKTLTAWAQYEGEQKALRQRTANRRRAEAGQIASWGNRRPFGFRRGEGGRSELVPDEAHALRVGYSMIRDGRNYGDVARYLTDEGFTTTLGTTWNARLVRQTMVNPRNAGRVVYGVHNGGGELVSTDGPAVIPPDEFDAILSQARRNGQSRKGQAKSRSLLAGLVLCGQCGAKVSKAQAVSYRRNRETAERDRHINHVYKGTLCGHVSAPLGALDEHVSRALLRHLASPLGHMQRGEVAPDDPRALEAATALTRARERADELTDMLATGELTRDAYRRASARVSAEIATLEDQARVYYRRRTALDKAQSPSAFIAAWKGGELSDADKRAVLGQHIESVTIAPRRRGRVEPFDPAQHVTIAWRIDTAPKDEPSRSMSEHRTSEAD